MSFCFLNQFSSCTCLSFNVLCPSRALNTHKIWAECFRQFSNCRRLLAVQSLPDIIYMAVSSCHFEQPEENVKINSRHLMRNNISAFVCRDRGTPRKLCTERGRANRERLNFVTYSLLYLGVIGREHIPYCIWGVIGMEHIAYCIWGSSVWNI